MAEALKETDELILQVDTSRIFFAEEEEEEEEEASIVVSLNDITERKKAEDAVRESEKRYRLLAENVTDVIWVMDMNLRLTYISPSIKQLTGFDVEEVMSMTIDKILTPSSRKLAIKTFKEELSIERRRKQKDLQRIRTLELIFNCKDGSTAHTELRVSFLRDQHNHPIGLMGVARDIFERKKVEEALKSSEEKLRSIFVSSPGAIIVTDLNGNIMDCNQMALDLSGYSSKNEMVLKSIFMLVAKKDRGRILEDIKKTLKHGTLKNVEYTFVTKSRKEFFGELFLSPMRDSSGNAVAFVAILSDITERKQFENELRRAYEELKYTHDELVQSEKMAAIGRFSSGLAHEIRNPLGNISASAQFCLAKYNPTRKIKKYFEIILRNSENANRIVKNLLNFARVRKAVFKLADIGKVVENTCKLVKARCLSQHVHVSRVGFRSLPRILIDKKMLEDTFLNIVLNALDAMPDGGELNITAYYDLKKKEIAVSFLDTGIGISQKDLNKIFEPFFTTRSEGTGLGLSLVQQVIAFHKGSIEVNSKLGKGTEVIVKLPVVKEAAVKKQKVEVK